MERKSKMGAAIIEGKHLSIVIDDEQRIAGTANDEHTRGLQLLQGRHANEISGAGVKLIADAYFGHVVQWFQRPKRWFWSAGPSASLAARGDQPPSNLRRCLDAFRH